MADTLSLFELVILSGAAVVSVAKWVRDRHATEPGTIEHEKARYTRGEIDERELERRLDVIADPEAKRIRAATERVSGIGPSISWDLAYHFDSLDELRDAPTEELTEVPDVGEQRAADIRDSF